MLGKPTYQLVPQLRAAFSTIEVLLCLVMLALLTAIALPSFQQAHVASNVSQARADLQVLKVGLESYNLDIGTYLWQNGSTSGMQDYRGSSNGLTLERLTTPISYLNGTAPFYDAFPSLHYYEGPTLATKSPSRPPANLWYRYSARNSRDSCVWGQTTPHNSPLWYFLESSGPDQTWHFTYQILNSMTTDTLLNQERLFKTIYDPTNGTVSRGSIWNVGGSPQGTGTSMATVINAASSSRISDWSKYAK